MTPSLCTGRNGEQPIPIHAIHDFIDVDFIYHLALCSSLGSVSIYMQSQEELL